MYSVRCISLEEWPWRLFGNNDAGRGVNGDKELAAAARIFETPEQKHLNYL